MRTIHAHMLQLNQGDGNFIELGHLQRNSPFQMELGGYLAADFAFNDG